MGRLSDAINLGYWERKVRTDIMAKEFSKATRELEKEVAEIVKKLDNLPKEYTQRRKLYLLRKAGKEFVKTVQNNISDSKYNHYRYKKNNVTGESEKITYHSGNLRKSIKVLRFRKSKNAVYVGPRVVRKTHADAKNSGLNDNIVDPFYAAMVEYGTRHSEPQGYMAKGYEQGRIKALNILVRGVERILKSYEKKNRV